MTCREIGANRPVMQLVIKFSQTWLFTMQAKPTVLICLKASLPDYETKLLLARLVFLLLGWVQITQASTTQKKKKSIHRTTAPGLSHWMCGLCVPVFFNRPTLYGIVVVPLLLNSVE